MINDVVVAIGGAADWSCSACTFLNLPTSSTCEICQTPNPSAQAPGAGDPLIRVSQELFHHRQPNDSKSDGDDGKQPDVEVCAICLTTPIDEECPTIAKCEHQVCQLCLTNYLEFKIKSGDVLDIHCPRTIKKDEKCKSPLSDEFVQEMVSEEAFQKFKLFCRLKGDHTLRQCPKCDQIQKGNPKKPQMTCENTTCKFNYCYFHASAHVDSSCKEFESQNKSVLKPSEAWVKQKCMPCIFCKAPTLKSEGCNHMTCSQCKGEFCYLCGGPNRGGKHFNKFPPWNYLYGCAGLRMAEERKVHSRDTCCHRFFQCFCTIPFFLMLIISPIIFIILELLWCILIFACCPLWCCGALCGVCITQDQEVVFAFMQPFFLSGTKLYYNYKYWWLGPD